MKRWHGSCLGAFLVLLVGGSSLLFFVPVLGAMIVGIPPVFDRLTAFVLCPQAVEYSYRDYGSTPIDSTNPSGGTAHYTELTCTYADGSQEIFPNEEVGLKGIGASFGLAAVCSGAVLLLLALLGGIVGGRLVKPNT